MIFSHTSSFFFLEDSMDMYSYSGPVELFGKVIDYHWEADTYATTSKKAASNLAHRYKKEHGYAERTVITLPGKLYISERG